jgi:hypothetical protein
MEFLFSKTSWPKINHLRIWREVRVVGFFIKVLGFYVEKVIQNTTT